ncbi:MAG TPA: cobalt ECF transporter T component CbiQ [Ktedonobacteraceae bacterium]|nr:cobalt ECF transporter T component CbiQ [Ktedonobacteraceae bacterium]
MKQPVPHIGRKQKQKKEQLSWLEHTLSGITGSVEHTVFIEEYARQSGWLQKRDPRAKLGMFLALLLAASLSQSLLVLAPLYILILAAAFASRVPFDFFLIRVWLGIPFFAGIVIVPSIFLAPGPFLFTLPLGPLHLTISLPGLMAAIIFVARVGVCVSLAVLLILVTSWADVLKSLLAIGVPHVFVLLLLMTYRYIFLFLETANGLFEARKSRTVGHSKGGEHRRWISHSVITLVNRSFKMSTDVYAAMAARGFTGHMRTYRTYHMRISDWISLGLSIALAVTAITAGRFL